MVGDTNQLIVNQQRLLCLATIPTLPIPSTNLKARPLVSLVVSLFTLSLTPQREYFCGTGGSSPTAKAPSAEVSGPLPSGCGWNDFERGSRKMERAQKDVDVLHTS